MVVRLPRQQTLIRREVSGFGELRITRLAEINPLFDARALSHQSLHEIDEGQIEENHTVFGVVDNVNDLLDEQARIDRMTHGAHAGDSVSKALDVDNRSKPASP